MADAAVQLRRLEARPNTSAGRIYQAIENAERVEFCEPLWGKYAGRVVARVVVDGEDLADELIIAGLARAYDGGQRLGWCGLE